MTPGRPRAALRIEAPDGAGLALEHVPAALPARAACVVGHAIMTSGRSLDRPPRRGLASTLAAAGIEVYVLDVRGHGRSRTRDWSYEDIVLRDLPAVTRAIRRRHPDLSVAGVGHSLTGTALLAQLATAAESDARPDAVVTLNTNIWLGELDRSRGRRIAKRVLCEAMVAAAALAGHVPTRRLRIGSEDVSRAFARDLARWTRTGSWCSPAGDDYRAALHGIDVPVLALHAAGDRFFCHPASGVAFHRTLGLETLEVEVVDKVDGGHVPGHMDLAADARSASVWRRIAAWLVACVGADRTWPASHASS